MRGITRTLLLLALAGLAACDNDPATVPLPAQLTVVSGNNQEGTVGRELAQPLVVQVLDDRGRPVRGQLVNFKVTSGNGAVYAGSAITDQNGIVQERWFLGTLAADSQRVEARAVDPATGRGQVFAVFRAVARPGPAVTLSPVQQQMTGRPGVALADSVGAVARDQYGNGVPGITVTWTLLLSDAGSVSPTTSVTDAQGVARTQWVLSRSLTAVHALEASAPGNLRTTFAAKASLGPGATLTVVSGNGQTGPVATRLADPLVVEVRQNGVPVSGVPVQWSTADGTLSAFTTTDAGGRASAQWTLGTVAGTHTAQAQVPAATPSVVTFTAQATPGPPARLSASPLDLLTREAGEVVNVQFVVRDEHGNRVPGATVNASATHGSVSPAAGQTDANGAHRVAWTLPTDLGPASTVQATLTGTLPGTTETTESRATVRPAAPAKITVTPDVQTVAANEETSFTARFEDAYGNRFSPRGYTGCTVAWSAPAPAQLTPQAGLLYPGVLIRSSSSVTLTATCGGLTDTAELVVQ